MKYITLKTRKDNRLILKAVEIKGNCQVYNKGDKTAINGVQIDLERSDKLCIYALFSLRSFIVDLREGLDPKDLGLSKNPGFPSYFQCLDPDQPWTDSFN